MINRFKCMNLSSVLDPGLGFIADLDPDFKSLESDPFVNKLMGSKKGWEFAHLLITHFAQIKWATVSDSLRSLKTIERPWANRSGRSTKMSDHEQFAQIAQRKWAIVWTKTSDSLRIQMSKFPALDLNDVFKYVLEELDKKDSVENVRVLNMK